MKYPFFARLHEFLITMPKSVALEVADKIYQFHIFPMQKVREELGVWITASLKSGWRPEWYEKSKGRSGNSQHVYKDEWLNGFGAVDWTCKDFDKNADELLRLIIKHTNYTRIAIYNSFIHCDYKDNPSGKRELYSSNSESEWDFVKFV